MTISLAVVATLLLLTGLVIAVADASASVRLGTAQPLTVRPGPKQAAPAAP